MKYIGITQRLETINSREEKRDALDIRWPILCMACNLLPILIPNHLPSMLSLIDEIPLNGFILSGGNSLHFYGGDAPKRDEMENTLLQHAINHRLPVLGVCRGMQLIQHFFGIPLKKIEGHVRQEHKIIWENQQGKVNSYHNFGTKKTIEDIQVLAKTEDGIIEAIQHRLYPITGIMWHPERNEPFHLRDKTLLTQIFG